MASTTWIKLNLPFDTPTSSPASIGHTKAISDIRLPELAPSPAVPLKEGNPKASVVITEGDLLLSTSVLSTDGHTSSRSSNPSHHPSSSPSSLTQNVHHLFPSPLSAVSPDAVSDLGQALLPGVEPFSSVMDPRVGTRAPSIPSMGGGHAHTSCRSSGFEERHREECNPDRHLDSKPLISNEPFPKSRPHPCLAIPILCPNSNLALFPDRQRSYPPP